MQIVIGPKKSCGSAHIKTSDRVKIVVINPHPNPIKTAAKI
jgi:hypothetical protein